MLNPNVWYLNYDPTLPPDQLIYNPLAVKAAKQIITFLRDIFRNGIDPKTDLAQFTAFFNPNSGGSFDANDWAELMDKPASAYFNTVDAFWDSASPNPGATIVWWTSADVTRPGYTQFLYDITKPQTKVVVLSFGMR